MTNDSILLSETDKKAIDDFFETLKKDKNVDQNYLKFKQTLLDDPESSEQK